MKWKLFRALRWLLAGIALLLVAALLAGTWLVTTEAGLRRAVALAESLGTVEIRLEGARGRLIGPLNIDVIAIDHPRASIRVDRFHADYEPLELLAGRISAEGARIGTARVVLRPATGPQKPPSFMPGWLSLVLDDARAEHVTIVSPAGVETVLSGIRGSAKVSHSRIEFDGVRMRGEGWAVAGAGGTLFARQPLALDVRAAWTAGDDADPDRPAGITHAAGNLERLLVNAQVVAPGTGRVDVELTQLTGKPRWRGTAEIEKLDLARWIEKPPVGPLAGSIEGDGDLRQYAVRGSVRGAGLPAQGLRVDTRLRYAERVLHVDAMSLESAPGSVVRASGKVTFGDSPAYDLDADWTGFRWPLEGRLLVASPRGSISAQGWKEFSWRVSGEFRPAAGPPVSGEGAGRLTAAELAVDESSWRAFGGSVSVAGSLSRDDARAWTARGRATNVNTALLREELPGRLSFDFEGSGRGFEPTGPWTASIRRLRGTLRGQPASGGGTLRRAAGLTEFRRVELALGSSRIEADGTLGRGANLRAHVESDDLSELIPESAGRVNATVVVRADTIEVGVTGHSLAWGENQAVVLSADARIDREGQRHSWVRIRSKGITLGRFAITDTRLALDGLTGDHALQFRVGTGQDAVSLRGRGAWADGKYVLHLQGIEAKGPRLVPWHLEAPGTLEASRRDASLDPVCIVFEERRMCLQGRWEAGGEWFAKVETGSFPLEALDPKRLGAPRYRGILMVDAEARGSAGGPWVADLRAEIRDALLAYQSASGAERRVELGLTRLNLVSTAERHRLDLRVSDAAALALAVELEAERAPGRSLGDLPLTGSVKGRTRQLNLLPLLVDAIDNASGEAELDFRVGGRVAAPALEGEARLADGTLDFYQANLRLRELRAAVRLADTSLTLDASGRAGDGTLSVDGQLAWRDRRLNGELALTGERLLIANVPEARVLASPDLRFRLDDRHITVTGDVLIPEACIQPADTAGAVLVSADERIVQPEEAPAAAERFTVKSDVRLSLGDRVQVKAFGLSAMVTGAVRTRTAPQAGATASGELEVAQGVYRAYGRELEIERGRLLFTGGAVTDPGVDLRAIRELPGYTVGVIARGPLRRPQLTLFSEPSLPQAQIASMLIVGRSNIQGDPGSSEVSAAEQGTALLAGQLGRFVGLDDVGLTQNADAGAELVFGKFLSPRLYVSYGISLVDQINTLKLRYTIGDRWVLSAESGRESAGDIEFRIER